MTIQLVGMTWDHPRGWAALEAASWQFTANHQGFAIRWEARSLEAFE